MMEFLFGKFAENQPDPNDPAASLNFYGLGLSTVLRSNNEFGILYKTSEEIKSISLSYLYYVICHLLQQQMDFCNQDQPYPINQLQKIKTLTIRNINLAHFYAL